MLDDKNLYCVELHPSKSNYRKLLGVEIIIIIMTWNAIFKTFAEFLKLVNPV